MSEFDQELAIVVEQIRRGKINVVVSMFEALLENNRDLREEMGKRE